MAKVRTGVEESRSRLKIHIGPATLVLNTFQRMIEKYFLFLILKVCISESSNTKKIGIKKYINI